MKSSEEIINKWYVDLYDQEETQTDDIAFMLWLIGTEKKEIIWELPKKWY